MRKTRKFEVNEAHKSPFSEAKGPPPEPKLTSGELYEIYHSQEWINKLRTACIVGFVLVDVCLVLGVVFLVLLTPRCRPHHVLSAPLTYNIYTRSFCDSDGDGMGDIKGLSSKLDHVESLGVRVIVLADPVLAYDQSQAFGKTLAEAVTDWRKVSAELGSMDDFTQLVNETRQRGLDLYMSLTPNHVSKSHPWFVSSVNGEDRYKNYFIWQPCTLNKMPNDWKNVYDGGSAWTYDVKRRECYLHQFSPAMPDLNYRSTRLRDDMESVLRFWLSAGVSGFSLNRVSYLVEDLDLRLGDNYRQNLRQSRDVIRRWSDVIKQHSQGGKLLVNLDGVTDDARKEFLAEVRRENLFLVSNQLGNSCDSSCFQGILEDKDSLTRTVFQLSSPSTSRIATSAPSGRSDVLHLLMLALAAGASLYYGDETAMRDSDVDPTTVMKGMKYSQYRSITPMPWTNQSWTNAWIPVNSDADYVEDQRNDEDSMLFFVRSLTALRGKRAFRYGVSHAVKVGPGCAAFIREWDGTNRYLIIANLGNQTSTPQVTSNLVPASADVIIGTRDVTRTHPIGRRVTINDIQLPANQGIVLMWPYER